MIIRIITLLFFLISLTAFGKSNPYYIPEERENFTKKEDMLNFGTMYGAQWAVYLTTQQATIKSVGSFKNWYTHPFIVGFDKDSFDYNIFQHTLTGQFYYLYYRSQGYTEKTAFFWTIMSTLAFEFTIETVTEHPSLQDIYLTPVFGSVVGVGIEKLSRTLHSTNTFAGHTLGYIINPMSLLPSLSKTFLATPVVGKKSVGAMVTYVF